jgi:DNA-binding transcriptional MerR regulator
MYISQQLKLGGVKLLTVRFWNTIFLLDKGRKERLG